MGARRCRRRGVILRSDLFGGTVFSPYSATGHASPVLRGLIAGQIQEDAPSSGNASSVDVLPEGFRQPRGTRDGGVVPVPTLIVPKKLAMCPFCGGKKGINHDESAMVWGCRDRQDADGDSGFE